jgi:vancomycin permeability regulator SanA
MLRVLGTVVRIAAAMALAVALAALAVAGIGSRDRLAPADLGVILGTWTYEDMRLSEALRARCDRGIEVYREGLVPRLMVTGTTDWYGGNEALLMRRHLLGAGIPDSAIVVDTLGVDTWRSALHAADWLQAYGGRRAMIVTEAHHILRSRVAFARVGGMETSWAHARRRIDWYSAFREVAGLVKYVFLPIPRPLTTYGSGAAALASRPYFFRCFPDRMYCWKRSTMKCFHTPSTMVGQPSWNSPAQCAETASFVESDPTGENV